MPLYTMHSNLISAKLKTAYGKSIEIQCWDFFSLVFYPAVRIVANTSFFRHVVVSLWLPIISTALLGFGVSGVLLSLWSRLREQYPLDKKLGILSLCLSVSVVVSFWLLQQIPFDPFSLYADNWQLLYMPLTYIVVSIPFFFCRSLPFLTLHAFCNAHQPFICV